MMTSYLSNQWLAMKHINQQLELLRLNLTRSWSMGFEVMGPHFFQKLHSVYRQCNHVQYSKGSAQFLWQIGKELENGILNGLAGIANVNNNHWIALVVDMPNRKCHYGDFRQGMDCELTGAIDWWSGIHLKRELEHVKLAITKQKDTYNCGVFALNALAHHILPNPPPLLSETLVHTLDMAWVMLFNCVATQDLKNVRVVFLVSQCKSSWTSVVDSMWKWLGQWLALYKHS